MPLSLDEIERYERQLLVPEWGAAGQERVAAAAVRLVGDGAAAEVAAAYLAAAGVGRVTVEKRDVAAPPLTALLDAEEAAARSISVENDTFAAGALVAVEVLKALLGLPFAARPALPDAA